MLNCAAMGLDPRKITWRQYLECLDENNARMDPKGSGGEITTDLDRLRKFRKAHQKASNDG